MNTNTTYQQSTNLEIAMNVQRITDIKRALSLNNAPSRLLAEGIKKFIDDSSTWGRKPWSDDEVIAAIAAGRLEQNNGAFGGVNVTEYANGQIVTEYVLHEQCTWMLPLSIVEQALCDTPDSMPDWFEPDWIQDTKGKTREMREEEAQMRAHENNKDEQE